MAIFVNKSSLSNLTLIQKVTFVDEAGAAQAMAELEDGCPFTFSFECDHFSIFRGKRLMNGTETWNLTLV